MSMTQAETIRKINDEQLGDFFDANDIPDHIYRIAVNLLSDKQQEIEANAQVKRK